MTLWDCIWRSLNSRTNQSHLQVTMELAENQIDLKQLTSYQLAQNVLDLQMESQKLQRDRSLMRQSSPGQSMKAYLDLVYAMTSREPLICLKFSRKTSNSWRCQYSPQQVHPSSKILNGQPSSSEQWLTSTMSSLAVLQSPVITITLKLSEGSNSSLVQSKPSNKSKPQVIGSLPGDYTHKWLCSFYPTGDLSSNLTEHKSYPCLQPPHPTTIHTSSHLTKPSEYGLANTTTSCSLDNAKFEDLWLYWLNPISAGALQTDSKMKPKGKSDFRCKDPCDRWN